MIVMLREIIWGCISRDLGQVYLEDGKGMCLEGVMWMRKGSFLSSK